MADTETPTLAEIKAETTWLQGVGAHRGKPAGELKVGDVLVWNGGSTSEVKSIDKETPAFITITTHSDGSDYSRRLKKLRIVAIEGMGVWSVTQDDLKHAELLEKAIGS